MKLDTFVIVFIAAATTIRLFWDVSRGAEASVALDVVVIGLLFAYNVIKESEYRNLAILCYFTGERAFIDSILGDREGSIAQGSVALFIAIIAATCFVAVRYPNALKLIFPFTLLPFLGCQPPSSVNAEWSRPPGAFGPGSVEETIESPSGLRFRRTVTGSGAFNEVLKNPARVGPEPSRPEPVPEAERR